MSTTTQRKLAPKDSARIKCHGRYATEGCGKPATVCETMHWNSGQRKGVSFFYYCREHAPERGGTVGK